MDTLVYCLYLEHHYADAEKMGRDLVDFERRVFGPDDPSTAASQLRIWRHFRRLWASTMRRW